MDNRTAFLNTVAQALGRPLRREPQAEAAPVNNYANERLTELSPQQRCDPFLIKQLYFPQLELQYHGRWRFSRSSSGWDRVWSLRHGHQVVQSKVLAVMVS